MIGVIVWAVLILFIVICTCPGFLKFFMCVALPVAIAVYVLASWLRDKLMK